MIPIDNLTASNTTTDKGIVIASVLSAGLIGFFLLRLTNKIFKPFDKIVSVDGSFSDPLLEKKLSSEFREPGETIKKKPKLIQRPFAPQTHPPKLAGWKPSNYETDRDQEERFYSCL